MNPILKDVRMATWDKRKPPELGTVTLRATIMASHEEERDVCTYTDPLLGLGLDHQW